MQLKTDIFLKNTILKTLENCQIWQKLKKKSKIFFDFNTNFLEKMHPKTL